MTRSNRDIVSLQQAWHDDCDMSRRAVEPAAPLRSRLDEVLSIGIESRNRAAPTGMLDNPAPREGQDVVTAPVLVLELMYDYREEGEPHFRSGPTYGLATMYYLPHYVNFFLDGTPVSSPSALDSDRTFYDESEESADPPQTRALKGIVTKISEQQQDILRKIKEQPRDTPRRMLFFGRFSAKTHQFTAQDLEHIPKLAVPFLIYEDTFTMVDDIGESIIAGLLQSEGYREFKAMTVVPPEKEPPKKKLRGIDEL